MALYFLDLSESICAEGIGLKKSIYEGYLQSLPSIFILRILRFFLEKFLFDEAQKTWFLWLELPDESFDSVAVVASQVSCKCDNRSTRDS